MHVLVTGASGFLGRHLVRQLLVRGDRVRGLSRRGQQSLAEPTVQWLAADVADARAVSEACRGVDVVYHVAAATGIWGSWQHYYQSNVVGTQNVIAACREHGVRRLVYTSSPSVTFDGRPQEGIDESAPYATRWLCYYPHTKALAEQAILAANSPDLATCALRPHLIWGPGDTQLIGRLIERARSGRLRRVGCGTNLIDTVYIDNAVAAHLAVADQLSPASPVAGSKYFLSQGQPVNCWSWIDQILALAGLPPVNRSISLSLAQVAGGAIEAAYRLVGRTSEPPMTRFLALQLGLSHYFDIRRAQTDFGYQPIVSIEEGMSRLAQSLQQ